MSDTDALIATINSTLRDLAKQASALGNGLQNAAPGSKSDKPNPSVQYLLTIADELTKIVDEHDPSQSTASEK